MGEPDRDVQQTMVLGRKVHSDPLAKGRRAPANVHRYVPHFSGDDAHQLGLARLRLIVETAQRAIDGTGMVILHKIVDDAGCGEPLPIPRFQEEASPILEHLRLDDAHAC